VPYRRCRSYGITILTGGHVERIMQDVGGTRLRLIRFAERGWDRHQDVWSYQQRST
jgi:hypothetical protein